MSVRPFRMLGVIMTVPGIGQVPAGGRSVMLGAISGGLMAILIVCATVLLALGKDVAPLLAFGGTSVVTVVISLLTAAKVEVVQRDMSTVKANTNGNLDRLLKLVEGAPRAPQDGQVT